MVLEEAEKLARRFAEDPDGMGGVSGAQRMW